MNPCYCVLLLLASVLLPVDSAPTYQKDNLDTLCVLEGQSATLGCSVRGEGYQCYWKDDNGMTASLDEISRNQIVGLEISDISNCGIRIHNVSARHQPATSTKYTCAVAPVAGADFTATPENPQKEASVVIYVVPKPVISSTGKPSQEPPPPPSPYDVYLDVADGSADAATVTATASAAGRTIVASTSDESTVKCVLAQQGTNLMWRVGDRNISANATTKKSGSGLVSTLVYQFTWEERQSALQCCHIKCGQHFCDEADLQLLYTAQEFEVEYPSSGGIKLEFQANPAPYSVWWGVSETCDDTPEPLDPTNENITATVTSAGSGVFSASLNLLEGNSTQKSLLYTLTVAHPEGVATHCVPYQAKGIGIGAIIAISVGGITTVTLLSITLYIYHRSKGGHDYASP